MPKRIQLKRSKGWRMPANTVKVDRSTKFGNPFKSGEGRTAEEAVAAFRNWLTTPSITADIPEVKAKMVEALPELRGKNLACWCKPGKPCHADVLLEIANA